MLLSAEKEIAWEGIFKESFDEIYRQAVHVESLEKWGIVFPSMKTTLNVCYDNPGFRDLLKEKFELRKPYADAARLTFVRDDGRLAYRLPYRHYGYVSRESRDCLVFAASFGIFKSTISGYASYLDESENCIPAHASVLSVDGKGILLTGGSAAGKTTTLLNLVAHFRGKGSEVRVLTDDWAIIKRVSDRYVAMSYDPSISLRQRNLDENPHLRFNQHAELCARISRQKKVSLCPDDLYGESTVASTVPLDAIVVLVPNEGRDDVFCDRSVLSEAAIDAAYHYPYISPSQEFMHKGLWLDMLNRLPVKIFHTRGYPNASISSQNLAENLYA